MTSQESESFDIASSDNGMQVPNEAAIRRLSNAPLSPTSNVALGRRSTGEILTAPIASTQQRSDTRNKNKNRNRNRNEDESQAKEVQKEIHLTPVINRQQQWYITMIFLAFGVVFAAIIIHFMCRLDGIDSRIKDIETKLDGMLEKFKENSAS